MENRRNARSFESSTVGTDVLSDMITPGTTKWAGRAAIFSELFGK